MMKTKLVRATVFGLLLAVSLASCNAPGLNTSAPTQTAAQATKTPVPGQTEAPATNAPGQGSLTITDVSTSADHWATCPGRPFVIQARLDTGGASVASVTLNFRLLSGDPSTPGDWQTLPMDVTEHMPGLTYSADLASAVEPGPAVVGIDYWVEADGADQGKVTWPASKNSYESVPVSPCETQLSTPTAEFGVDGQWGPSASAVQYGSCATSVVTFQIVLNGAQQVQSVEVKTTWQTAQGPGAEASYPLAAMGPSADYPGATRYAFDVDLAPGAEKNLGGGSGTLEWDIVVGLANGQTDEFQAGNPPAISVSPCP